MDGRSDTIKKEHRILHETLNWFVDPVIPVM
jgi:hypothetical protein